MKRFVASAGALIICLLVGISTGGCGTQSAQADASDLTAGHRAELITVGGARLDSKREQHVTFRADAGTLKVIAELTGTPADLACKLSRAQGDGEAAQWQAVAVTSSSRPAAHGVILVLRSSSPLEPGVYRLTYTGHGWLKYLGVGANY